MKGKSLALLIVSLLVVLGLGGGIGGLWEEARAEEPEAPGQIGPQPVGTAFTYQGRLIKDGNPVDGTCDFGFTLWDSLGFEPIAFQSKPGVIVTDGLFTVELDFGAGAFQGDARWLEITVRCPAGTGFYTPLSPHQELTAAPYALYALEAADVTCSQCVSAPEVAFSYAASSVQGGPALDLSCAACIDSGEIANGAVTSAKIQDGEVSATDLEDGAALAEILDDDGSGSGLDADLLDGYNASQLMAAAGSASIWGLTTSESVAEMDSFTVNAPGPGTLTVVVMGSAYLDCDATSSSSRLCSAAYLGICDTSASTTTCGETYSSYYFEDPDNVSPTNEEEWIALARTVNVGSAGARTFYLNGRSHTSGMLWRISGYVLAIFTPASMTVTNP